MMPKTPPRTIMLTSLGLFAGTASAHPGEHGALGFIDGLAHLLLQVDHLFAIGAVVALALWAVRKVLRTRQVP